MMENPETSETQFDDPLDYLDTLGKIKKELANVAGHTHILLMDRASMVMESADEVNQILNSQDFTIQDNTDYLNQDDVWISISNLDDQTNNLYDEVKTLIERLEK